MTRQEICKHIRSSSNWDLQLHSITKYYTGVLKTAFDTWAQKIDAHMHLGGLGGEDRAVAVSMIEEFLERKHGKHCPRVE